jgi:hypothetical protein
MRSSLRARASSAAAVLAFVGLWGMVGCGPAGPKTYPVRGKVELAGGDASNLAGNNIEAAMASDSTVRASGVIQPDGSFTLETLHAGVILKGAQEGNYQVRLILDDDGDRESKRRRRAALHPRYLDFKTSGLSFKVPTEGDVLLKVAPR